MKTNTIYHGDCLEVMRQWPDESIGLVVTSPPYNLNLAKAGRGRIGGMWNQKSKEKHTSYENFNDNLPHDQYVKWQRECLTEMLRLIRPDGAIFYNHKWRMKNKQLIRLDDLIDGFPVRQIIIWSRGGGINFQQYSFLPTYEVIYLICKDDFLLKKGANVMSDVWRIAPSCNEVHPATFPIELPKRCISSSIFTGPVLDPFMGIGTTAIAAENEGAEWVGIEQSAKYVEMANARIEANRPSLKFG